MMDTTLPRSEPGELELSWTFKCSAADCSTAAWLDSFSDSLSSQKGKNLLTDQSRTDQKHLYYQNVEKHWVCTATLLSTAGILFLLFIHDKHLACIGDCHSQYQLSWVFITVFIYERSDTLTYLHVDIIHKKYLYVVLKGLVHFTGMILQLLDDKRIATSWGRLKLITYIRVILLYRILFHGFI